ncbi:hypothetical protein [Bacillus alkalisoli]|uniref:hypothetical protein n=1 Tax=Bacillus alkalisoli TaxID=2011008 RepID=UPI000C24EE93|nr:hypothetical protein [Bacillus alkalisoli]
MMAFFGFLLFILLIFPPVADLMESIMIVHMHMQMPLLVIAGFLMGSWFQKRFPSFFAKWNEDGTPGILLFSIVMAYWLLPRTMDDALTSWAVQWFKYIGLPLLAGVPLRDSWLKLSRRVKNVVWTGFSVTFSGMGMLYTLSPVQLCNNYLLSEQITLGWGFITMAICMVIYLAYVLFVDASDYE